MSVPRSPELERGALGCILASPAEAANELMSHYPAGAKLFWEEKYRLVWEAIVDLVDAGNPVDEVTLCDYLQKQKQLNQVGGLKELVELFSGATSSHGLKYYCDQLHDLHVSRELISVGQKLVKLGEERAGVAGLDEAERHVLEIGSHNKVGDGGGIKRAVAAVIDRLEEQHAGRRVNVGLPTGLSALDDLIGGLRPGQLIVVAARPSRGKTALATQIALEVAVTHQKPTGIFSLEMTQDELVERMASNLSGVNLSGVSKDTTEAEFVKITSALAAMNAAGLRIVDRGGLSVQVVRASARRMVQRHHVSLLVVDYIQLMHGSNKENRSQEVSEISRGLKALAKELKLPIIALSQLNRLSEVEGRKPRLSDLRESGAIEQDADVVVMIHWPSEEVHFEKTIGQFAMSVELLVEKNRSGRTGLAEVWFCPPITKFIGKPKIEKKDEYGADSIEV